MCHLHIEGEDPAESLSLATGKFISHSFFVGKSSRAAVAEGRGTYCPVYVICNFNSNSNNFKILIRDTKTFASRKTSLGLGTFKCFTSGQARILLSRY